MMQKYVKVKFAIHVLYKFSQICSTRKRYFGEFSKGFNLSYLDGVSLIISNGIYEGEDIPLNHITKCFPRLLILLPPQLDIKDNSIIAISGFNMATTPEYLILELYSRT